MTESDEQWIQVREETIAAGARIGKTSEQFNDACEHIAQLLQDASALFESGSHATSAFLSIAALEETAKVHMGMYRRSATPLKRSKDPLFKHERKHELALGPTVAMGGRLQAAIGEARMRELIELGRKGGFVPLREASLYIEQQGDSLLVPMQSIPTATSRELLLLAIESFDDALVGYTNRTEELSELTDALFAKWAGT
jgi:AbiV family abortive infection protein